MREDEELSRSSSELDGHRIDNETDQKDRKSRGKLKSGVKKSKKKIKEGDATLGQKVESSYNKLTNLMRSLVGLKQVELDYEIEKEDHRYASNKKKYGKENSRYGKLKDSHSGIPGIDYSKEEYDENDNSKSGRRKRRLAKANKFAHKAGGIIGLLMALGPMIYGLAEKAVTKVKEGFGEVVDNVVGKITALGEDIRTGWDTLMSNVTGFSTKVSETFSNIILSVNNFISGLWNKIAESKIGQFLGLSSVETVSVDTPQQSDISDTDNLGETINFSDTNEAKGDAKVMAETGNRLAGYKSNGGKYNEAKPEADSEKLCARHTVDSINAGLPEGTKLSMPKKAADLFDGNELERIGFSEVPIAEATSHPRVGDVVVEDAIPEHPYGHIQLYTGDKTPIAKNGKDAVPRPWVSDFRQRSTNVHGVQGPKKAWRYGSNVSMAPESGNDNLGKGSGDESGTNVAQSTTNNTYNNYKNNNSRMIYTGSNGAEDQRY